MPTERTPMVLDPAAQSAGEADQKIPAVDVSIVVPVFNERESLPELLDTITATMQGAPWTYEILCIDDGSWDGSMEYLVERCAVDAHIRAVQFQKNQGKSAALSVGFQEAGGDIIITMDADLQDDPREIPNLIHKLDEGYELVSGWKRKRHDPLGKRLPSRIFNFVTALVTGIRIHDFNCGLKCYRRQVTDSIQVYGELHRYIPVLAKLKGFRVGELPVQHHPRKYGKTKFGVSRFFSGFFDLVTVIFLSNYLHRPLHLFGIVGLVFFLAGFAIDFYLTLEWFAGKGIGDRPLLFLGMLLILVGMQFGSLGLLGELIANSSRERNDGYVIKKRL